MFKPLFSRKPDFHEVEALKISYNIGCLMDIPTGNYVKGLKGENILNGGLAVFTGITGGGNTFKSTIAHFMILSALAKVMASGISSYNNTYDTEMNILPSRIAHFARRFEIFKDIDIVKEGIWSITDKTKHIGNEWYKILKEFLREEKIKNKKNYLFDTPFRSDDGAAIKVIFPTFGEVDSISEFETADISEIQDKNEIGESGGNTIHMRIGLAKTRLLMEIPTLLNSSGHYMVMTAHMGENNNMQQSQYAPTPMKKLPSMRTNEKIKGVTDKFFFLPNNFWQTMNASPFLNNNTKGPEYPKTRDQTDEGSNDLFIVRIKQLRSKSGPSGVSFDIILSQSEGVLPSLTEFHFIKENGRFGLDGNNVNYNLVLYPEEKLGRTTVRYIIDTNPYVRRAIKITADLLQIKQVYGIHGVRVPDIKEFYEKLDKKYGFKNLLETRDYWTFDQYENKVPFLSTFDMLEMFYDRYEPYWMKKGK